MKSDSIAPSDDVPAPQTIAIFTDGACIVNPGPGGYGVVIARGTKRTELFGGFRRTTNNRMELMAAIVALESLPTSLTVRLYTDSKYLQEGMSRGWAKKWRRNHWKTRKGLRFNYDLWGRLIEVSDKHNVEFLWVPGHAGNAENERCDVLATLAATGENLPPDIGYKPRFLPNCSELQLSFSI
jgi:ribonuclease HI